MDKCNQLKHCRTKKRQLHEDIQRIEQQQANKRELIKNANARFGTDEERLAERKEGKTRAGQAEILAHYSCIAAYEAEAKEKLQQMLDHEAHLEAERDREIAAVDMELAALESAHAEEMNQAEEEQKQLRDRHAHLLAELDRLDESASDQEENLPPPQ
ncbi:expressed unknown protein [Seminavis robusta]|uniref:Uncharacterized protein n=1 Tax=Seminavis robusta TaxID=568900 RepID=A0A9N8HSP4_9STRA|nr:expressed unknown protein [Seminavis robusta]|eukprot:Sro1755_g295480.1 n/a (158) ;mRNA; f:412-885